MKIKANLAKSKILEVFDSELEGSTIELWRIARNLIGDLDADFDEAMSGAGWKLCIAAHNFVHASFSDVAGNNMSLVHCKNCQKFLGLIQCGTLVYCKCGSINEAVAQ